MAQNTILGESGVGRGDMTGRTARQGDMTGPTARPDGMAGRIARQTLAHRESSYAGEVRRLLDAALEVIRQHGTSSRPRVADIVAAAGLSNDAFYRYFPSRDSLVAALLDEGTDRLAGYLRHQMGKERSPAGQVHRWVEGVLSQAHGEVADTTLAVMWNAGSVGPDHRRDACAPLATLLREPFAALGSDHPELDADLVAHAVLGKLSDYLWAKQEPSRPELEHLRRFSVAVPRSAV
jgi:AcrR family transcriptional regulator